MINLLIGIVVGVAVSVCLFVVMWSALITSQLEKIEKELEIREDGEWGKIN